MFQGDTSVSKFMPYTPAMKLSGMKIVAMIVSVFMISFMRLLTRRQIEVADVAADVAVRFHQVDQLHRVVVAIAEEQPRLIADERRVLDRNSRIASRSGQMARRNISSSRLTTCSSANGGLPFAGRRPIVEVVEPIADVFQHRKVGVDHRVDQPIRQVVGLRFLPHHALLVPQPVPHQVEAIARPFLERDHVVLAEDEAELLGELILALRPASAPRSRRCCRTDRPWPAGGR